MKSLSLFCLLFFFWACIKEVTPDFTSFQSHLVINAIFDPDSVMRVHISKSVRADKPDSFPLVENAQVTIHDGSEQFLPDANGAGTYSFPGRPLPGKTYTLLVKPVAGNTISASTKIPMVPDIRVLPLVNDSCLRIYIRDDPSEKNVYWVGLREFNVEGKRYSYYDNYVNTNFLLFDDFNRIRAEDVFGRMTYAYHFYARLPDILFNGKEVTFTIPQKWPAEDALRFIRYRKFLYIIQADHHLDQYMKAALIQYDLGVVGDMPVFYTPIDIYTNISDGKGIFGSCTISQFDISKP